MFLIQYFWSDIDRVIQENQAIRDEVNEAIGKEWKKMCSADQKEYLKEHVFKNSERCGRMIDNYRTQTIDRYQVDSNIEYLIASTFRKIELCRRSAQLGRRLHAYYIK